MNLNVPFMVNYPAANARLQPVGTVRNKNGATLSNNDRQDYQSNQRPSFLKLQRRAADQINARESGYTQNIDPKLAVALTASNDMSIDIVRSQTFEQANQLYQDRMQRS